MGRLSNPYEGIKILISQGSTTDIQARSSSRNVVKVVLNSVSSTQSEEEGRLSNLVQRRMATAIIDHLVEGYVRGLADKDAGAGRPFPNCTAFILAAHRRATARSPSCGSTWLESRSLVERADR